MLFFQEGGGCFSAETCAFTSGTYDPNVDTVLDDPVNYAGVFDFDNPRNPFADFSFVFVPYCTGDSHLGDAVTEYSSDLTVRHNGHANATAALDYLVAMFPNPDDVIVAGESAGSMAAPFYAGLLSDSLANAHITVIADGSGGYPDNPNLNAVGEMWGVLNAAPAWPEFAGIVAEEWSLPGLFIRSGHHDPDIVFARHDYAQDATQVFFTRLFTGTEDLLPLIDANEDLIEGAGIEVSSYIAPGDDHTVLHEAAFYTEKVNGVLLTDWVAQLAHHERPSDVHCEQCWWS